MKDLFSYKWIEGYKATNLDMTCKDFQYELGKKYVFEGKPVLQQCGFHLCLELENTFKFYNKENSRFFKVKALVHKDQITDYRFKCNNYGYERRDLFAAKEIEFIEEVSFDEMKQHYLCLPSCITTNEEYRLYYEIGASEYFKRNFLDKAKGYFQNELLGLVYDEKLTRYSEGNVETLLNKIKTIHGLDCGKDCKIQMLMMLKEI